MTSEVSAVVEGFEGFNQAADNNKEPILKELIGCLAPAARVLEVGSGSGQHAAFFCSRMPQVSWHPTDRDANLAMLTRNLSSVSLPNLHPPRCLDVAAFDPGDTFEAVFCANVVHIMPEALLPDLFEGAGRCLAASGQLLLYGPFRYQGRFTTASNARFDDWLKARDPRSGIRDIESLIRVGSAVGLTLTRDTAMPANNQFLVFERG